MEQKWIDEAFRANGLEPNYILKWSDRMFRTMGIARLQKGKTPIVGLSRHLWAHASREERKNTCVHEAAHIIAVVKYGPEGRGHGRRWRVAMIRAGEKPSIYHNIDPDVPMGRSTYRISCACKEHWVTEYRFNKADQLKCRSCGSYCWQVHEPHVT